jgi:hypothetical protein
VSRSTAKKFVPALVALLLLGASLAISGCGGSDSSQAEINEAKRAGAAHAREQIRIKQIQHELRALRHGRGGAPVPPSDGSSGSSSASGSSSCGDELSVNSVTTCPFAENVRSSYFEEIGSGSGTVYAYSPTTDQTYSMYCTGSPHECTGGNDAALYFP